VNKFDGIIFDIDGTLTATNELIFSTFNHITEKYLDTTYTPKDVAALFGPTEGTIIKNLIGENFDEAFTDYHDYYEANHNDLADAYDGIIQLVENLHNSGVTLSIYTGKGRRSSEITLKEIGLIDYFDMIVTGDDIKGHKPSPEGIDVFIETFNIPRERVLMVGDAPSDVKAARATGIKIASVLWDAYAKEEVMKMGSDYYFHSVEELQSFLLS